MREGREPGDKARTRICVDFFVRICGKVLKAQTSDVPYANIAIRLFRRKIFSDSMNSTKISSSNNLVRKNLHMNI